MSRFCLLVATAVAVALGVASPAHGLGPGTPDLAFGRGGAVRPVVTVPADPNPALPLAVTAENAVLVGGVAAGPDGTAGLGVERFGARGAVAAGFGTAGLAVAMPGGTGTRAIVAEPDGGLVAVGTAPLPDGRTGLAAVRLDARGVVRWTALRPPPAGASNWTAVDAAVRAPDGTVVISGTAQAGAQRELAIARLEDADGTPASTFAGGELVDAQRADCAGRGDADVTRAAAVAGGAVVVAVSYAGCGELGRPATTELRRFGADGHRDAVAIAGAVGRVTGLVAQPDGSVLLAASALSLTRYDAALRPDTTFDARWLEQRPGESGARLSALALQPDGRALVTRVVDVSSLTVTQASTLLRLLPDGRRDRRFSPADLGSVGMGEASTLAVAADGGVLIAGRLNDGGPVNRVLVARVFGGSAVSTAGARGPARRDGGSIRLRVRCAGPGRAPGCAGLVRLRTVGGRPVGHATYTAPVDAGRTVTVRVGRKGRRALRRATRKALVAVVTNGPGQTRSRRLRLVRTS